VGWAPLRSRVRHLPDVIIQTIDILSRQAAASRWVDCDILIEPELGNVRLTQLNRAAEIVEKGRQAAQKALPEIEALLAETA
jgi:predicted acylesterase/phospholipase RssA